MRKYIFFILILLFNIPGFSQDENPEAAISKLNVLLSQNRYEEAQSYFMTIRPSLDPTTDDMLSSMINIGLYVQNRNINIETTVASIKRVINEFSIHKEDLKKMDAGMMVYFQIYISFLEKIKNPYYLDVYHLFKDIWPEINRDYSTVYINVLENVSFDLFTEAHYEEDIPIFKELIELYNQGYELSSKLYTFYNLLGICYDISGNNDKAAASYDYALIYFTPADIDADKETYIKVVRNRFEIAFRLSQLSKCKELGEILIDYYGIQTEYSLDYIDISMKLSGVELSSYNTTEGLQHYEKGLFRLLNSSDYTLKEKKDYLENLYTIYNTFNISEKDRKFQSEAKDYNISTGNQVNPIIVDDYFIELINDRVHEQGSRDISDVKQFVDDVVTLASHYSALHLELQGIQLIENAISRCKSSNFNEQEYAKLYCRLGTIYSNLQNYNEAIQYHKKAYKIYRDNGIFNADFINIICSLADDYLTKGDLSLAKAHLDEAWDLSLSMEAFKTEKTIYYNLLQSYSSLYMQLGDAEKALSYNSMIIEDISDNDASRVFKEVYQIARVQLLLYYDRYKEAQNILDEIDDVFFEEHESDWTIFETKFFNDDTDCITDLEKLSKNDRDYVITSYTSLNPDLLKDFWDTYGGNLNMAYSMALYKFNTPSLRISTYNNLLFTKNFQLELNKYSRAHPNEPLTTVVAEGIMDNVGSVSTIKNGLKDNEVAIEYFFVRNRKTYREIENKYGALILRKDLSEPVFVELCACDSLDQLVYTNTSGEAETYADKMYNINNSTLYHLIWEQLEKEIPLNAKVFVSGCGSLLYVNFSALSNGKVRLDELYDIDQVVSTSTITSRRLDKHSYQSATIFGGIDYDTSLDTMAAKAQKYSHTNTTEQYALLRGEDERGSWGKLKHSLEEVNDIDTYLSNNNLLVKKYIQSDASEEAFKSLSGSSPDIIHISTHGFYYQPYMHSFRSEESYEYFSSEKNNKLHFNGLLFSGANNAWKHNQYQDKVDDGILTAQELYSLDLSGTDLVVLSACQTGLGENNEIDGNEGLLSAFKIAGVNNVIITLWNISDDATSYIMKNFYKNLLEVKEPREALKKTIDGIKNEMPDPYYWAGFIVLN